jgi:hypothetical protein
MLIAVVLLKVTDKVGSFRMPVMRADVAKALVPLIAINVLGLGVNTLCLVYVDTSFYQVRSHPVPCVQLVALCQSFCIARFLTILRF